MFFHRALPVETRALLILYIVCFASATVNHAEDSELNKLDISVSLFRSVDQMSRPIGDGSPILTVTTTVITQNDTIQDLLRRNGVYPNMDALGVVYALNPELRTLSPLKSGLTINLPKVQIQNTEAVRSAFESGFLVSLSVDAKLKGELTAIWKPLRSLTSRVSRLGSARFANETARGQIVNGLDDITDSLHDMAIVLRENSRPLSHDTLAQTYSEARLLQTMLAHALQSGRKLDSADQKRITLIDADIKVKMRNLDELKGPNDLPTRWRDSRVVVETLKNEKPVMGLRVYYVPEALYGNPSDVESFSTLSSPSEAILAEADYIMWAAKDGDPSRKTSEIKVRVRKDADGRVPVQLVVTRPTQ